MRAALSNLEVYAERFLATRGAKAIALAGLLAACQAQPSRAKVSFSSSAPIGTWAAEAAAGVGASGVAGAGAGIGAVGGEGGSVVPGSGGAPPVAGVGGVAGAGGGAAGMAIDPASASGGVGGVGAAGDGASAGIGGMDAGGDGAAGTGAAGAMLDVASLQFGVLTKTLNGRYSPKNIGAIWISSSTGTFVKTLAVWADRRQRYLSRWRTETASNRVDAVTSATLRSHVMHTVSWDMLDVNGALVAPGDYKVIVEITDHDGTGDSVEVPFTVGEPTTLMPSDAAHFVSMSLALE